MEARKKRGLRTGFTTGACAAAAARAATLGLLSGRVPEVVPCLLPNGMEVSFAVVRGDLAGPEGAVECGHPCSHPKRSGPVPEGAWRLMEEAGVQAVAPGVWAQSGPGGQVAHAEVVKDAGDDPDCTHGAHLVAEVQALPGQPGVVQLCGGAGVGRVTLPGLGLEVGGPAINPVPRRNIEANVRAAAGEWLTRQGLRVTISVPGGEIMARKTLNARLGIVGGISILGTTGVVKPYSTAAYRASVVQGIEVAAARGLDTVVLTTGGRTEKFVMRELAHLDQACFVQMGDFLRYALDTAAQQKIAHVVIGGMVGKLTKMAQGETITHAGRAEVNTALLAELAEGIGVPPEVCADIRAAETARYAAERMEALGLVDAFHQALAARVVQVLAGRYPGRFTLKVLVCDFEGNWLAEAGGNGEGGGGGEIRSSAGGPEEGAGGVAERAAAASGLVSPPQLADTAGSGG